MNYFHLMSVAFVMLAIVAFWKGQNAHSLIKPSSAINGLPVLLWEASNPTDFVLYSEQDGDGAYRYLCTFDQRKCLPAREVMSYINAHGVSKDEPKR